MKSVAELKDAARSVIAAMFAQDKCCDATLSEIEDQLTELLSRQLPGSDREDILAAVRDCVTEALGKR